MTTERDQILEDVFTAPETVVAGLRLRPFSLGTLNLCRRLRLTLFIAQQDPGLSEEEKQRQIVAFL